MTALPHTDSLRTTFEAGVLHVTLQRPERRNALSPHMLDELLAVFAAASAMDESELRAIVLRGADGNFCAGADIKEMRDARAAVSGLGAEDQRAAKQALARANRRFGDMMSAASLAAQPVIALVEGAAMGGGLGLVCVADIVLATRDVRFGLPETGLGVIPAQVAPFLVQRLGITQTRRLMLTGARIDGGQAVRLGLVHELCDDAAALEASLQNLLAQIYRCAPRANATTKRLLLSLPGRERELERVLDEAAQVFADAALGDEAREGALAFVEKRLPKWVP